MNSVNHHYLPQVYLKNFTSREKGERKLLWEFDPAERQIRPSTTKDSGLKKHYHTIEYADGTKDQDTIEKSFHDLENRLKDLFDTVRQQKDLSVEQRSTFFEFAGLMHVRVPKRVDQLQKFESVWMKRMLQGAVVYSQEFRPMCAEKGINAEMIDSLNIQVSPISAVICSLESTMVPVQFFSQMVWTFLVAPDGYFFCTSDNPAYLYATRRTENKTTPLGLASPDAEILFPLHRKVCAHGRWGTGDGGYRQLTREQLDGVNFITVVKSYRYFYSPAKTEWLLKFFELKVLEQIAKNQPQPQL